MVKDFVRETVTDGVSEKDDDNEVDAEVLSSITDADSVRVPLIDELTDRDSVVEVDGALVPLTEELSDRDTDGLAVPVGVADAGSQV